MVPLSTHTPDEVGHATGKYHQRVRTIDLVVRMWRPSVAVFAIGSIARGGTDPTPVAEVEAFGSLPLDVPGRPVPVPTPGHTSGHSSFHLPDHGIVITGDALVNRNVLTNRPVIRLMPRIFSHDWEQALASSTRWPPSTPTCSCPVTDPLCTCRQAKLWRRRGNVLRMPAGGTAEPGERPVPRLSRPSPLWYVGYQCGCAVEGVSDRAALVLCRSACRN